VKLIIKKATLEALDMLAEMNKQLIEDEQHDNTMSLDELKNRMKDLIRNDYEAYLFLSEEVIKGYALVNPIRNPVYLRQFFICRDSRGMGLGKTYFQLLLEELKITKLDVEVMYWNETGYQFWKAVGFKERSVYLRLQKEEN